MTVEKKVIGRPTAGEKVLEKKDSSQRTTMDAMRKGAE